MQSVVQARLDRLKSADKALAQCAAIAGQRVDAELLAALVGESAVDAARLIEAGLLRPEGAGFVFTHALVLEGVYGTLLRARRRELHRRAAAHYAARDLAVAAGHLERAEDPGAPEAYRRAAAEMFGQGRVAESLVLAERGLRIAQTTADRAALGFACGETLLELGRGSEAEAAFRTILDIAATAEDRCHAWNGIAASQRLLSRIDDAFASLAHADEARGSDDTLTLVAARTHYLRGNLHFSRGEVEHCRAEHEAALTLARAAGSIEYEIRALNGLGDATYGAGRMRTALSAFERCGELCRTHGFPRIEQACALMIGAILRYFNEHGRSIAIARDAIAAAERAGNRLVFMILKVRPRTLQRGSRLRRGRDDGQRRGDRAVAVAGDTALRCAHADS